MAEHSVMQREYEIDNNDFTLAGEASSKVKKMLTMLGISSSVIKKVAIAMYEAEINAFIHGGGGKAIVAISPEDIRIIVEDHGKGIPDLGLAMQEGYSTASEEVRMLGFGAGMGLPNIKRNADDLIIETAVDQGTKVKMTFNILK